MIRWMLGRLEQSPHAVFSERELKVRFPKEFEGAKSERLIRRVTGPPSIGSTGAYAHQSGVTYVVVPVEGGYEAFDPEDPEADPVVVDTSDLVQWSLDLEAFARKIQQANGLTGTPEALDHRLWFLGESDDRGKRLAYFLAFLREDDTAVSQLSTLAGIMPRTYSRRVVLCPSVELAPTTQRQLEDSDLELMTLEFQAPDSFVLANIDGPATADPKLEHSDDYRTVRWQGHTYSLSPLQAEVVSILHQVFRTGAHGLSWEAIGQRLSRDAGHMSDIFKRSDPRKALIIFEKRGRVYRLNL